MNVMWPQWLNQPFQVLGGARKPDADKKREDAALMVRQHLRDSFTSGRHRVPNLANETAWARVKLFQIKLMLAFEYPEAVWAHLSKFEKPPLPGFLNRQPPLEPARAERILKRLLAVESGAPQGATLRVFRSLRPNAFAAGVGQLGITDALIKAVRNDNELAFVLAHELAHERHRDNPGLNKVLTAGPRIFPRLIAKGHTPEDASRIFESELKVLQQQVEREADIKAVQWMRAAGFDPQGAVSFLQTLQKFEQGREKRSDGSHPPTSERIKVIQSIMKKTPSKSPTRA